MSRRVEFYTISLNRNDSITDCSVVEFFLNINEQILGDNENVQIVREIGEKLIRLFPYYYSGNHHQIVIPFGKYKNKNKPYWLNDRNHLEEIPADLYDINSLGFDIDYNIMLFTTNREGPSVQNVEEYLNTFIPTNAGVSVKIEPIIYNTGIEKVRHAELVRNVTLNLDLGRALNNFYTREIDENTPRGMIDAFRHIAEVAKDEGESKTLSLTLGLGKSAKKSDTLNINSMLQFLEHINIVEDFVKEIIVHYKNGRDEKIDQAKLKESNMLLFYLCKSLESQISPECLLGNINDAVADKVLVLTRHNAAYFANVVQYNRDMFDIVTNLNN